MKVQLLYEILKSAVEAEILAQQADRANLKSLRAVWAERLAKSEHGKAVYRFETTRQVHPSLEDAPVVIDTGKAELGGEVVFASGYEVHVATEDVGESLGACQLLIDLTFILERLYDLLEKQVQSASSYEMWMVEWVFGLREVPPQAAPSGVEEFLGCLQSRAVRLEQPNSQQVQAIRLAVVAPVLFLWGPPGTGKTTTLAWIAEVCLRRGESVLLLSNTNVAVDRALIKVLDALGSDGEWMRRIGQGAILRLGVTEQERLQPILLSSHLSREEGFSEEEPRPNDFASQAKRRRLVEQAQLIACTLAKVVTDPYVRERRFDVVLLDEGSMAPLPYVAVLSALCRKHVVIGGDFRQLPPISLVREGEEARWLNTDIYTQAGIVDADGNVRRRWNLVTLTEQWRMQEPICELINEPMYEGMLQTPQPLRGEPKECLYLVDTGSLQACSDRTSGHSHFNVVSALVCVGLANYLLRENPFLRVGIITPYNAQASLIHAMLLDCDLAQAVRVATVHRFQGEERQAIILDCVDAPPFGWVGQFLRGSNPAEEGARLLNVAVTRAQQQLYVVGDVGYLQRRLPPQSLLRRILQRISEVGTVQEGSRWVGFALEQNRLWRWVREAEWMNLLMQDLREAMRGRGEVLVMEPLLVRDDGERLVALLRDLLRTGVEVQVIHYGRGVRHERTQVLQKAGAQLTPLQLPPGRQEYQDWCVFVGKQAVWWGSVVVPYREAAFVRISSRATMNELQFLRRPRKGETF